MTETIFLPIILAILGSGGFTALITALIGANQRRKDRNDTISKKLDDIEKKLDEHIAENEMQFVLQDRARIIAFADECSRKVRHSSEAFDDILKCIDHYEEYCETHKTFKNNKAVASIEYIKKIHQNCMDNHDFL